MSVVPESGAAVSPMILIVDDEPRNRRVLEVMLRPEGYRTHSVGSGRAAIESIAHDVPDLVLLDIMMPGMDGYEVACELKATAETANVPIILVSSQDDRCSRLAGLTAGAEEFLTKPVDRAELTLRVRNLLRLKAIGNELAHQNAVLADDLMKFRNAMDVTADAIMLVDRETLQFVEVNSSACLMLGYSREELLRIGPAELGAGSLDDVAAAYDAIIANSADLLSEATVRCHDGSPLRVEVRQNARCFAGRWIIVAVLRDITERIESLERLHNLAHYDVLTGLPNRTLFYQTLEKTLAHAAEGGFLVDVLCIDLDQFKSVNDSLGHSVGDLLLREFSGRLVECVRVRDTIARLGGDEFALILVARDAQDDAAQVANKIRDMLREPFELDGNELTITASIGVTVYPTDAQDPETLMKYADTAMYRAKHAGGSTFRFFTQQMNTEVIARLELELALRGAVENGEFVLHYQPIASLTTGRTAGLEALLRWQRPGHGLVLPQAFIGLLEETGLIVRLGSWIIDTVCRQIAAWNASDVGPMHVSVNVAGRQFVEADVEGDILRGVAEHGISGAQIEIELTERSLFADNALTSTALGALHAIGVQVAVDDFGTGYSSFAYLRSFPVNKLKIDMRFVRQLTTNPDDAAIVLAIIHIAHSLKLEVVAEGVETEAQLMMLRRHGCDLVQGYLFSPPLAVDAIEAFLREDRRLPLDTRSEDAAAKTLMLIDDEPDVLVALQRVLRHEGYRILVACSAAEAFELLALNAVQVIVCDTRMSTMSGTTFFEKVKEMHPDVIRIVLSGQVELESVLDSINRGEIYRFFTKPWDNDLLRNTVRQAFRHHRLVLGAAAASAGDLAAARAQDRPFVKIPPAADDLAGSRPSTV